MYHIIVNPGSSGGRGLKNWQRIEPCFLSSGEPYTVYYSDEAHTIRDLAASITETEETVKLVILGGDGSVNEAVNGIRDFDRVLLGFIPTGSGNDLGRSLGLPRLEKDLVDRILEGKERRSCDIGEVLFYNSSENLDPVTHQPVEGCQALAPCRERRLFNISAGIGFEAECCAVAQRSPAKPVLNTLGLGRLIYIYAAIRSILKSPMVPMRIVFESDKGRRTVRFRRSLLAVAMNQPYEGGGFLFGPHASATDDLLDVCMAGDLNRLRFFYIFPTAYTGAHLKFKGVSEKRAHTIHIESKVPLWVHTDGEVTCKSSKITIRPMGKRLRLLV